MKRTREHIGQILERSLAWHRNPSRSEIQSAVNRVWESLPDPERVELSEKVEHYPSPVKFRGWRFAAVAAVLIALSVTVITSLQSNHPAPATADVLVLPPIDVTVDASADALLIEAVNAHISRTIPAPMEPILTLIPTQEDTVQQGGTQ
jgi:hypothetical protein